MPKFFLYRYFLVFFALGYLAPSQSLGKVFKNSYIRFEMPDRWHCEIKLKAWICRSKVTKPCLENPTTPTCKGEIRKSQEALIVMAAKEKSKVDSLDNYLNHFGEVKPLRLNNGNTTQSKVAHAKMVGVQKNRWVDAMHLSSELPNYYTRYLATIKGNVAVLVTYTSHKKYYTQYSTQFFKSIKSLQVITSDLKNINKNELGNKMLSHPIDIPDELFHQMEPLPDGADDGLSPILFALAMLLAGTGLFIWMKSRKSS